MLAILMAEKMSGTSVKMKWNVGMTPCQKLLKQEGTARRIVACSQSSSQCLLVSTVFGTVSSLHPTSFLMIFTLVSIQGVYIVLFLRIGASESLLFLGGGLYWNFHFT